MDDNVKNRTSLSAQYDPFIDRMFAQKGWVCPKCGRVYSPFTPECFHCNNQNAQSGVSTNLDMYVSSKK
jgi:uncharacterized OB-fold protein